MASSKSQEVNDEAQIRALIERWAKAVREENCAVIRLDQFRLTVAQDAGRWRVMHEHHSLPAT